MRRPTRRARPGRRRWTRWSAAGPSCRCTGSALSWGGPDPRDALSADTSFTVEQVEALAATLARWDARSPWTRQTLELIRDRPATRAPDLAASVGRETAPFKRDVRRLKELGLTHSLEVGYRLSPRGRAYLDLGERGAPSR